MEIKIQGATIQSVDIISPFAFANQAVEKEQTAFFLYCKNKNCIYWNLPPLLLLKQCTVAVFAIPSGELWHCNCWKTSGRNASSGTFF